MTDPNANQEKDLDVGTYTRRIRKRGVQFTCAECGETVTEQRFPGPMPKYCLGCVDAVRRRQAR
ncbi:MAG: hypothetical protein AAF125_11210, partial [Chloroflexota bacterium]